MASAAQAANTSTNVSDAPWRMMMSPMSALGSRMPRAECETHAEQLVPLTIAVDAELGICSCCLVHTRPSSEDFS